jgi:hypothetical protein
MIAEQNDRNLDDDISMTLIEWIAVLKLTFLWKMEVIEDWAVKKIPGQIQGPNGWISALKLATQMNIPRLREIAIQSLRIHLDLNPLQKYELAVECKIYSWLYESLASFVNRDEGISEEDELKLGWERTSKLFRLRNRRFEQLQAYQSALRSNYRDKRTFEQWYSVESDIRTTFASDFTASDSTPRGPNLRTDIKTVEGYDAMKRDDTYYFVDLIFRVSPSLL